jgi:hypothetical protein
MAYWLTRTRLVGILHSFFIVSKFWYIFNQAKIFVLIKCPFVKIAIINDANRYQMTFYFDISIKSINIYAKLMIFNKFINFWAHLFILMIIPNNLVNAMPIFIIYNIKI